MTKSSKARDAIAVVLTLAILRNYQARHDTVDVDAGQDLKG